MDWLSGFEIFQADSKMTGEQHPETARGGAKRAA
jgi:hypothetical protein